MKGVKCILSQKLLIILALFFIPFLALLSVDSSSALTKDYAGFKLRLMYSTGSDYVLSNTLLYDDMVSQVKYVNGVRAEVNNVGSVPSQTSYISVTGKFNLVALCFVDYNSGTWEHDTKCPSRTGNSPYISAVSVNSTSSTFLSDNVNVYVTDWVRYNSSDNNYVHLRTFTYDVTFLISNNIPTSVTSLAFFIEYPGRLQGVPAVSSESFIYSFEGGTNNRLQIDFTQDKQSALLQQQIQIQQQQIQQDQQDRSELQNTSDNAQQDADSAAQQVNQASASLLTIMGNYINIILNPPESNCQINMSVLFSRYKSGDYGSADLCSLAVPNGWNIIGSFLLIGLLIPFVISTINTFLYLLKGATQD